jgi:hypothetical protein
MSGALWFWLRRLARPSRFSVTIRAGRAVVTKAPAPPGWVVDCGEVAAEFGVDSGHIDAVPGWHGLELRCSPDVPPACQQRLRNLLAVRVPTR